MKTKTVDNCASHLGQMVGRITRIRGQKVSRKYRRIANYVARTLVVPSTINEVLAKGLKHMPRAKAISRMTVSMVANHRGR
jgi:hypothetical protein